MHCIAIHHDACFVLPLGWLGCQCRLEGARSKQFLLNLMSNSMWCIEQGTASTESPMPMRHPYIVAASSHRHLSSCWSTAVMLHQADLQNTLVHGTKVGCVQQYEVSAVLTLTHCCRTRRKCRMTACQTPSTAVTSKCCWSRKEFWTRAGRPG